jgi:hypothetical protein
MLSIPAELRGRVISIVNLSGTFSFLGGLAAGIASDILGSPKPVTIIMAGSAACVAILVLTFSPTIRNYRLSQGIAAGAMKKSEDPVS